jgi:dihydrofolate synthase/folylpolyglutamate synthase
VTDHDPFDDPYAHALEVLAARGPGRMVPDLSRITALCELLGDPQHAFPSVHVTGTNGKGSVVRMVGALCAAAGLSAGTYTSPHLQTVRERLSLAGRPIAPSRFAELHAEVDQLARLLDERAADTDEGPGDPVTYFELLTAMGFAWFADVPVDVGIVEVGMGGRWDATNVLHGTVAVLTTIDVDHPQLGGTPAEVAEEKLGIIEPHALVVSGPQTVEVQRRLRDVVRRRGATLWQHDGDGFGHLEVVERAIAVGGQLLTLRVGDREIDDILLPLHGAHQADNAAIALAAAEAFAGAPFGADLVAEVMGRVRSPGRLEVVGHAPLIVLDGAHNVAGARALAAAMANEFAIADRTLVVGLLREKDPSEMLEALDAVRATRIVCCAPPSTRARDPQELAAAARALGVDDARIEVVHDVADAVDCAVSRTPAGGQIVVTGSLYVVGAARAALGVGSGRG